MSRLGLGMQGQDRNPRFLPEAPAIRGVSVAWAGAEGRKGREITRILRLVLRISTSLY